MSVTNHVATSSEMSAAAEAFFLRAENLGDTDRDKFASLMGLGMRAIRRVFPQRRWVLLQDEWMLTRLRQAMNEAYAEARVREDFTIRSILCRVRLDPATFHRVAGGEWRELAATLPTAREKVLEALDKLVATGGHAGKLTARAVFEEAGVEPGYGEWLAGPLRAARFELAKRQSDGTAVPLTTDSVRVFPGGWIDLDADEWVLGLGLEHLRRHSLRPDVAEIAWPLLREELRAGDIALGTVRKHYRDFITAGAVLGEEVSDIRGMTLETLQRAWSAYEGTRDQRAGARSALTRLTVWLAEKAKGESTKNFKELLGIVCWLSVMLKVPADRHDKAFLTEGELNNLILCCLADIKRGIEFTAAGPDLPGISTRTLVSGSAAPVVRWSIALMVLVMALSILCNRPCKLTTRDAGIIRRHKFMLAMNIREKSQGGQQQ